METFPLLPPRVQLVSSFARFISRHFFLLLFPRSAIFTTGCPSFFPLSFPHSERSTPEIFFSPLFQSSSVFPQFRTCFTFFYTLISPTVSHPRFYSEPLLRRRLFALHSFPKKKKLLRGYSSIVRSKNSDESKRTCQRLFPPVFSRVSRYLGLHFCNTL